MKAEIASEVAQNQVDNTSNQGHKALSWASYHALQQPDNGAPTSIIRLLPPLNDNSHLTKLIEHSMGVMKAFKFFNAGQTPVLTMDQLLYALAKAIQWTWPGIYREQNCIILMGVSTSSKQHKGGWLIGYGPTSAIAAAGINSFRVARISSRHMNAAALYVLLCQAFHKYSESNPQPKLTFHQWQSKMAGTQLNGHWYWAWNQLFSGFFDLCEHTTSIFMFSTSYSFCLGSCIRPCGSKLAIIPC
ncbi:hypothetical protein PoB_005327900 [Plakobranchus ocellatus]|uniref:Uncharacterized protein n=1 Tax=Plakobranchus ocellatus TaxID=259542 RepID=A0AAV4C7U4_9GAST|nr:hypothetical protein PoB_005327900 [Plakobranchus ocellatus]